MKVAMKYSLTRRTTGIYAKIESCDILVPIQGALQEVDELVAREHLLIIQAKVIVHMALGYYQRVALGDGEAVVNSVGEFVFGDYSRRFHIAEKAVGHLASGWLKSDQSTGQFLRL